MSNWTFRKSAEFDMKNLFGCSYTLYRYYEGEKDTEIPDVMDYLSNMLNSAQDRYEELMTNNKDNTISIEATQNSITILSRNIERVQDEKHEYWYAKGIDLVPIVKKRLPIKTPDAFNGKLVWKETGYDVWVYAVPRDGSLYSIYYVPAEEHHPIAKEAGLDCIIFLDYRNDEYDKKRLFTHFGYVGFDNMQNILSNVQFVKCKDCGKVVFGVDAGECKWYADKGWGIPKRCKECRINRA